jgi:uncharacterized protein (DUF433 family)
LPRTSPHPVRAELVEAFWRYAKFSAGNKVTGANALIREYAKSVVSPGHLAAADGFCVWGGRDVPARHSRLNPNPFGLSLSKTHLYRHASRHDTSVLVRLIVCAPFSPSRCRLRNTCSSAQCRQLIENGTAKTLRAKLDLQEVFMNSDLVKRDPEIMSGALCFSGTRVPVKNLFDYLEGSSSLEEFLEDFPTVSRIRAVAVLEAARASLAADAPAA